MSSFIGSCPPDTVLNRQLMVHTSSLRLKKKIIETNQHVYLNIKQLAALNFMMSIFHASTCFEHMCWSSGSQNCTIEPLVSSHWNKWVFLFSSSSCSWRVRHVSLFLDPQDEVGPSISSSVVLCFFFRLVCILVLVLVVCLCPSFVHVLATFPGTVLFPVLCSVLQFFV